MKSIFKTAIIAAVFAGAIFASTPSADARVRFGFSYNTPRYGFSVGHSPAYFYSSQRSAFGRNTFAVTTNRRGRGTTAIWANGRGRNGTYVTSNGNFGSYYAGPRRTYTVGTNGTAVFGRRGGFRSW